MSGVTAPSGSQAPGDAPTGRSRVASSSRAKVALGLEDEQDWADHEDLMEKVGLIDTSSFPTVSAAPEKPLSKLQQLKLRRAEKAEKEKLEKEQKDREKLQEAFKRSASMATLAKASLLSEGKSKDSSGSLSSDLKPPKSTRRMSSSESLPRQGIEPMTRSTGTDILVGLGVLSEKKHRQPIQAELVIDDWKGLGGFLEDESLKSSESPLSHQHLNSSLSSFPSTSQTSTKVSPAKVTPPVKAKRPTTAVRLLDKTREIFTPSNREYGEIGTVSTVGSKILTPPDGSMSSASLSLHLQKSASTTQSGFRSSQSKTSHTPDSLDESHHETDIGLHVPEGRVSTSSCQTGDLAGALLPAFPTTPSGLDGIMVLTAHVMKRTTPQLNLPKSRPGTSANSFAFGGNKAGKTSWVQHTLVLTSFTVAPRGVEQDVFRVLDAEGTRTMAHLHLFAVPQTPDSSGSFGTFGRKRPATSNSAIFLAEGGREVARRKMTPDVTAGLWDEDQAHRHVLRVGLGREVDGEAVWYCEMRSGKECQDWITQIKELVHKLRKEAAQPRRLGPKVPSEESLFSSGLALDLGSPLSFPAPPAGVNVGRRQSEGTSLTPAQTSHPTFTLSAENASPHPFSPSMPTHERETSGTSSQTQRSSLQPDPDVLADIFAGMTTPEGLGAVKDTNHPFAVASRRARGEIPAILPDMPQPSPEELLQANKIFLGLRAMGLYQPPASIIGAAEPPASTEMRRVSRSRSVDELSLHTAGRGSFEDRLMTSEQFMYGRPSLPGPNVDAVPLQPRKSEDSTGSKRMSWGGADSRFGGIPVAGQPSLAHLSAASGTTARVRRRPRTSGDMLPPAPPPPSMPLPPVPATPGSPTSTATALIRDTPQSHQWSSPALDDDSQADEHDHSRQHSGTSSEDNPTPGNHYTSPVHLYHPKKMGLPGTPGFGVQPLGSGLGWDEADSDAQEHLGDVDDADEHSTQPDLVVEVESDLERDLSPRPHPAGKSLEPMGAHPTAAMARQSSLQSQVSGTSSRLLSANGSKDWSASKESLTRRKKKVAVDIMAEIEANPDFQFEQSQEEKEWMERSRSVRFAG